MGQVETLVAYLDRAAHSGETLALVLSDARYILWDEALLQLEQANGGSFPLRVVDNFIALRTVLEMTTAIQGIHDFDERKAKTLRHFERLLRRIKLQAVTAEYKPVPKA